MTKLLARTIALGALMTMEIACAETSPTAPPQSAVRLPATATATSSGGGPQACLPDSKLIGRVAASTADTPGTWWRLTKDRFDALGVTDYKAALEAFYGRSFDTLDDAIAFLIGTVEPWDANGNGYVCAYQVRGTRAGLGEIRAFLFGIADDKHVDD